MKIIFRRITSRNALNSCHRTTAGNCSDFRKVEDVYEVSAEERLDENTALIRRLSAMKVCNNTNNTTTIQQQPTVSSRCKLRNTYSVSPFRNYRMNKVEWNWLLFIYIYFLQPYVDFTTAFPLFVNLRSKISPDIVSNFWLSHF